MFGFLTNDDDDEEEDTDGYSNDLDSEEQKEMEIALYSQLHFGPIENTENVTNENTENLTSEKYNIDIYHQCEDGEIDQDEQSKLSAYSSFQSSSSKNESDPPVKHNDRQNIDDHSIDYVHKDQVERKSKEKFEKQNESEAIKKKNEILDHDQSDSDLSVLLISSDTEELELDSDLMILDETFSDMEDLKVHVNESQQHILKRQSGLKDGEEKEDVKSWAIIDMDRYSSSGLKKRYYKPISVRCNNCRDIGHLSKDCQKPQKNNICFLCGFTGHNNRTCPNGICYNCEEIGHISYNCPNPWKNRRMECHRCSMLGHSQYDCPDTWRQFHITTIPGSLRQSDNKENKKMFCYNCASSKHFGYNCPQDRMDKHSQPSYPFVAVYRLMKKYERERLKRKRGYNDYEDEEEHTKKKARHEYKDRNEKINDGNKLKKLSSFASRVREKMESKSLRKSGTKEIINPTDRGKKNKNSKNEDGKHKKIKDDLDFPRNTEKKKIEFKKKGNDRTSFTLRHDSDNEFKHQVFDNQWWEKKKGKNKKKKNSKKTKGKKDLDNVPSSTNLKQQNIRQTDTSRQVQKTSRGFKISFNTQNSPFRWKH